MGRNNGDYQEKLAMGLGWFSIGLGLAEVLAPDALADLIGMHRKHSKLLRIFGFREIASGIGILTQNRPTPWLWSRVAGDALDLATIGSHIGSSRSHKSRLTAAAAAVAGVTALDVLCSQKFTQRKDKAILPIRAQRTLTISRPADELYRFWRNFEQLPQIMNHVKSVKNLDEKRSHWVVRGPANMNVEWDAEIIEDRPGQLIRWQSLPGATVDNSGSVQFQPARGNRGTVLRAEVVYNPPAGLLGSTVAKLFGEDPEKQLAFDLMRFKQLMETGEIARTEGQPAGRAHSTSRKYDDFVRV
jgi:uncharacterized membrane protein